MLIFPCHLKKKLHICDNAERKQLKVMSILLQLKFTAFQHSSSSKTWRNIQKTHKMPLNIRLKVNLFVAFWFCQKREISWNVCRFFSDSGYNVLVTEMLWKIKEATLSISLIQEVKWTSISFPMGQWPHWTLECIDRSPREVRWRECPFLNCPHLFLFSSSEAQSQT